MTVDTRVGCYGQGTEWLEEKGWLSPCSDGIKLVRVERFRLKGRVLSFVSVILAVLEERLVSMGISNLLGY